MQFIKHSLEIKIGVMVVFLLWSPAKVYDDKVIKDKMQSVT